MLVFIDESGDAGLKLDKGSSRLFTVVLVVFEETEEAEKTDKRIDLLRSELGLHPQFEFHFNGMNHRLRRTFLETVSTGGFFYYGIVINKTKLTGPGFRFKESFYKYACSLVFENAKPRLSDATIVIDGSGSKDFQRQLGTYLRKKTATTGGGCLIRKVKIQDSKKNNLLQLADMVCGSVARRYTDKAEASVYSDLISHREMAVQLWPR